MLEICINMRYSLILFLISSAFCQSDFIKPSDFNDNPPKFPTVNLPSFSSDNDLENISSNEEINLMNRNCKMSKLKLKNQLMNKLILFLSYQIINLELEIF